MEKRMSRDSVKNSATVRQHKWLSKMNKVTMQQ